jgi:hypothetical protein
MCASRYFTGAAAAVEVELLVVNCCPGRGVDFLSSRRLRVFVEKLEVNEAATFINSTFAEH